MQTKKELLNDLDKYRKDSNRLNIEVDILSNLLLSFMLESKFDSDSFGSGYFKVSDMINEAVSQETDNIEFEYQENLNIINKKTSKIILEIGRKLISLHSNYSNIHKVEVTKNLILIYMYNKDLKSELCFTVLGVEEDKDYDCKVFIDSDWAMNSNYIQNYDKILKDIVTIIFGSDDSYHKNNISIEEIIELSNTAQNPLMKNLGSEDNEI